MPQLNEASKLISTTELLYDSGDYDAAFIYAIQGQSRVNGLTEQANILRQKAEINSENKSFFPLCP